MPQEYLAPIWIDDNETLIEYCQDWLAVQYIVLDTEFTRTNTFYPIPGLIQLGIKEHIYLIDPLAITHWQPFLEVLQNPNSIKILHSCSEDLEVFQRLMGGIPKPLFDTQLAAAYANIGYSIGYQKLVNTLLGYELPKDETRSNWQQRPLTAAQIQYAALDVAHLLEVHHVLQRMMSKKKKNPAAWLTDDCNSMQPATLLNSSETAWHQVKRAWQLKPQQLAVLQSLYQYREKQAQSLNCPRNKVIPKGSLWPLARYQPSNLNHLERILYASSGSPNKEYKKLLTIIKTAKNMPKNDWPAPLPGPLPKSTQVYSKTIKYFLAKKAEELELPIEILLPSKIVTAILRSWVTIGRFDVPNQLQGWRYNIIGKPLIDSLNKQASNENTHISL